MRLFFNQPKLIGLFILASVCSPSSFAAKQAPRLGPNTTVAFELKKAALSDSSKEQIKDLLNQARGQGEIKEVQIAVWSDNPVPPEGKELSKNDRDLAKEREEALKIYLKKNLNVRKVEAFNMASHPNWLSRTFETSDAKLKSEIVKGENYRMSEESFKVFRDSGDSSKAVILVIFKN